MVGFIIAAIVVVVFITVSQIRYSHTETGLSPWVVFVLVILFAIGIAMMVYNPAHSHSAPSGWKYPGDCCDPEGRECDPIPFGSVSMVPSGGYRVELRPGDHPFVKEHKVYHKGAVRNSGDGEYHACISRYTGSSLYCLFIPTIG